MSGNSEFDLALQEYLAECDELLQKVSHSLQKLEKGLASEEMIDSLYRDVHTIKGSAQLFGYQSIGEVAHAFETCLDPIRKNKLTPSGKLTSAFLRCVDVIEQILNSIKSKQETDFSFLIAQVIPFLIECSLETVGGSLKPVVKENLVPLELSVNPEVIISRAEPQVIQAHAPAPVAASAPVQIVQPAAGLPVPSETDNSTIRVPVALLDKLMTLMGEMVLVRNQVQQFAGKSDDLSFINLSQRLDIVTSEIQGEVMKTRMQPIGNVLSKFQRVVRDLARDLNKKIDLVLVGADTELDKTLLEAVKDPLMHIVRNSCDHGIETMEARKAAKKPEIGKITIKAFHEGGQVVVEIGDDGKGLSRDKLIEKAIEKGLLSPEKAKLMSDRDAHNLIFAPGFSTAAQVTNVSGRGVGMDVVKNNIEGIGGAVELQSQFGAGTTIRLKIPLTLAILPTMIVRSGSEQFAIPQVKLVELVRVEKGTASSQIELLQGKPIYRLRGNLLPLVSLRQVLGTQAEDHYESESDVMNIVVLNAERRTFGLIVDDVQDTAEVVVKPLSTFVKSLSIYSGATVLGDGSIALILDVAGIALSQHMLSEAATENPSASNDEDEDVLSEEQEFLLFKLNSATKHAIPLNLVHRLEEFKVSDVEFSGGQRLVRYRNTILPIISLNEHLGLPPRTTEPTTLSIIVTQKSSRFFGIEVNEILDVLNTTEAMNENISDRTGILGNLFTSNEVVVVVDTLQLIDIFNKKLNPEQENHDIAAELRVSTGMDNKKVLLVEDTVFFRKHIRAVLHRAGMRVVEAENGVEALKILDKSDRRDFDLILSDIEMPKMNGLVFAGNVRKDDKWKSVPLVAITTLFGADHLKTGKDAGFDAYLEKLNPDVLLNELVTLLDPKQKRKLAS